MPYRLIAIDLDGTLLDSKGNLPPMNRVRLHRAHEAGVKIVLCTGRSFTETRPVIDQIGLDLDATVTVGGALITDVASGATLEAAPIPRSLAEEAVSWFQTRGFAVLWLHDRFVAGDDGFAIDGRRRHRAFDVWLSRSGCLMQSCTKMPNARHEPLRVTIVEDEPALLDLAPSFRDRFDGRLSHNMIHVPAYGFSVIEAFAGSVNKWSGIERLCRRWKIDPRETAAIGDDVNDIAMLSAAGMGIAVANAKPEAKAAARRTTASNDEGGVARAIDELLSDAAPRTPAAVAN
ncbi:MAG: HAD family hydrolase [Planctomycetes bacterium]|nr:HAD family hydrolase [Planctomycetota bacterium]